MNDMATGKSETNGNNSVNTNDAHGETLKDQVLDHEPNETISSDTKASEAEIEKLQNEILAQKDKYLRVLAEMENLKRRNARDIDESRKFATERLMHDLLPVLDSFDKAFEEILHVHEESSTSDTQNSIFDGFKMVHKQLEDALLKHGLSKIIGHGEAFDPNLHQAIQRIEADHIESDTISKEFAKGYLLNGRLLRASMVCVETPKKKT